ncbi:RNA polymerase sigma factor [Sedimentisphaera salicampi]|uniref:Sigma-W factor n=1 Tax=Sedimentisphaera salicampi TaxID=1941349 RepID=A0A1W6LLS3_9BACT|nr:sigma-70 family RNA polymerase sigma factor [Sedimentisphaera salicampi]ARN56750.1 Sigma-W factor [Sedimentisphaera salicampi]OXU15191.1 Sigma-W factor [Sedimentisphaera salicampi]
MNAGDINKENLIAGCKKGDQDAYRQLVDMYSDKIYGYFAACTRNPEAAEELLSEFYLKLLKSIKSYKNGSFEAWIFKIAGSVYYDYLRKIIRERENYSRYCEEKEYLDRRQDSAEPETDVDKAVSELDEDSRNLVMLRYYSDMSFKEIAEATGRPVGTVLTKIHRALKKMKTVIENESR